MIFKALVQVVLAFTMFEFAPVDAGQLEYQAELPKAASRALGIETIVEQVLEPMVVPVEVSQPVKVDQESFGIVTTAVSALVLDQTSGTILFEKNANEIRSIGSITKLMTAYAALQAPGLDLDAPALVTEEDLREGGHLYLYLNDQVTVRDLLHASLVGSDNSATIALARLTGWTPTQFVQKMNMVAYEMGLVQTNFEDPTGLSIRNRSTTHEITKMLEIILSDPEIQKATTQATSYFTSQSGTNYAVPNTNELLTSFINEDPYQIVGGKTGYLPEAGYCLAVQMQEDQGHDIFVVVLGAATKEDRFREVKGLTQWAYDTHDWPDQL
jgi:D-alanyl-D-alanine carboxypeptidase